MKTPDAQTSRPPSAPSITIGPAELATFFADIDSSIPQPMAPKEEPPIRMVRALELPPFFGAVKTRLEEAETRRNRIDRTQATGFNVFDLIAPDENCLSDILADLLDPKGKHGQGDVFLRLLFEQLGIPKASVTTPIAKVQREAPTHGIQKYRRRIDVLVDAGMLLAIENKVDAMEQMEQVADYFNHLKFCNPRHVLIYLSPEGRRPESLTPEACHELKTCRKLHCWSYQDELRTWLEACRKECKAAKIRMFLADFIAYIQTDLVREAQDLVEEPSNEG